MVRKIGFNKSDSFVRYTPEQIKEDEAASSPLSTTTMFRKLNHQTLANDRNPITGRGIHEMELRAGRRQFPLQSKRNPVTGEGISEMKTVGVKLPNIQQSKRNPVTGEGISEMKTVAVRCQLPSQLTRNPITGEGMSKMQAGVNKNLIPFHINRKQIHPSAEMKITGGKQHYKSRIKHNPITGITLKPRPSRHQITHFHVFAGTKVQAAVPVSDNQKKFIR